MDKPLAAAGASALSRGSGRRGGKFSKEEGKKGKKDAKKKLSKKEKLVTVESWEIHRMFSLLRKKKL